MKIRSRLLTKIAGWAVGQTFHGFARTLRIEKLAEQPGTDPSLDCSRTHLYSLWHDAIVVPIAAKSLCPWAPIAALVSRHQDGSYLAEFMRQAGIQSIRGSSRHGGSEAVRQLMRQGENCHVFITPDGPRGPKRVVKQGIVYLASQTGMPIVPVASRGLSAWTIHGSWTDLTVPKPFSRCLYLLGTPLEVPPDLSRTGLEHERQRLQSEMERIERTLTAMIEAADVIQAPRSAA